MPLDLDGKNWNVVYVLYFSISMSLRINHLCFKKKKKTDSAFASSIHMYVLRFQLPTKERWTHKARIITHKFQKEKKI